MKILAACLLLAVPAPALADSLWEAEVQLGYGISKRTSTATTVAARTTEEMHGAETGPLSFAALGAVAVTAEPHVFAFGGLVGEALERTAIGATAGARLELPGLPIRASGAGVWMVAPKTLWGATASIGACAGERVGVCGDVQLTAYVAGTALPEDELELQLQLVLGFVARGGR